VISMHGNIAVAYMADGYSINCLKNYDVSVIVNEVEQRYRSGPPAVHAPRWHRL